MTSTDLDALAGGRGDSVARAADSGRVRLGRLTAADRDFVAAHLSGLQRTLSLLNGPDLLRTSCGRTATGLVLSSRIGSDRSCEVRLTVQRAGIHLNISDRHEGRQQFLRRLLTDQGVVWERLAAEGAPLLGLLRGAGKDHRLRKLEAIGAGLPFLVGLDQSLLQFRGLLPDREAAALLLECAGAGIGHQSFLLRGGRELVGQALEPLLLARRHALATMLGSPARSVFMNQVLRIAQDADRDLPAEATVRKQIRDAFRQALWPTPTSARSALVELTGLFCEELIELGLLSRPVGRPSREAVVLQVARLDQLANRADLVVRRMRRGFDLDDSVSGLQAAVSLLDAARGELGELKQLVSEQARTRAAAGAGEAPAPLIESAQCAAQILSRIALSLRERSPRSHEQIGRLVDGLAEVDRSASVSGPRVGSPGPRERWLALRARLTECGEELFEASLQSTLREEQRLA